MSRRLKKKKIKKRNRKINKKRVLICFFVFFLIFIAIYGLLNLPLKNIYVYDNKILSDQIIIDQAQLTHYPNLYAISLRKTARKLEENEYILKAQLERKRFSELHIFIKENRPLYYIDYQEKTVLYDGGKVAENFHVPVLINYVPDLVYDEFQIAMREVSEDVLRRISEIKYNPSDYDDERFLFYMIDGNYVFVNLDTVAEINDYNFIMERIISEFGNKKGTLYLDGGGYFDPFY